MEYIYADIELINGEDLTLFRKHIIGEDEIKRMPVSILVDKGSYLLAINENIQEQLKLPVVEQRKAQLTNGRIIDCDVVAPVELKFKNRRTTCRAIVLPKDSTPILGRIPFDDMDVLIHPIKRELIVNPDHPYFAQMKMK